MEPGTTESSLLFLRHCYKFLNQIWQHADRELLPDQGFEMTLRESCVLASKEWRVSQPWERNLGNDLETSSGTLHEIDLVVELTDSLGIVEAKNRSGELLPTKNDVIFFFAKILDYLTCNPEIVQKEVCPVFLSVFGLDRGGLAACLGLGIHPIGPSLRPLPLLVDSIRRMEVELRSGGEIGSERLDEFTDFRAQVNQFASFLENTWFIERFGFQSQDTMVSRAVRGVDSMSLSEEFRKLNGFCAQLIDAFKSAKATRFA